MKKSENWTAVGIREEGEVYIKIGEKIVYKIPAVEVPHGMEYAHGDELKRLLRLYHADTLENLGLA